MNNKYHNLILRTLMSAAEHVRTIEYIVAKAKVYIIKVFFLGFRQKSYEV